MLLSELTASNLVRRDEKILVEKEMVRITHLSQRQESVGADTDRVNDEWWQGTLQVLSLQLAQVDAACPQEPSKQPSKQVPINTISDDMERPQEYLLLLSASQEQPPPAHSDTQTPGPHKSEMTT